MTDPEGRADRAAARRVYCIVPRELAPKLHEALRKHFQDDPSIEVIVERRDGERRCASGRRERPAAPRAADRRRIRSAEGRRIADRRADVVPAQPPGLPRKARPYAERLVFVERLEPAGEQAQDVDTARLVMRIQSGDAEAFGDLYVRYFDHVYNYLRLLLNDPHQAEDATQQVFTRVLEALPDYERRHRPFRAWLFTVVRNQAIDRLRRLNRLDLMDPGELVRRRERETTSEVELSTVDWISDRELLLFIERLPLSQRQVLVLRYMLDLSHNEIAAILDRSPEDVRVLLHRALGFLRKRLTAIGRGPSGGSRIRMRRGVRKAQVLRSRRYALM